MTVSSEPPSKDLPGKAPNTFNGRKPTKKKPGAQKGHKGHGLSKADVQQKIRDGIYGHRIETVGVLGRATSPDTVLTWKQKPLQRKSVFMRIKTENSRSQGI